MYLCKKCKLLIAENDIETNKEYYEAWGQEFTEETPACPNCGEFVEEHRGCDDDYDKW